MNINTGIHLIRNKLSNNRGFTLAELMVAMSVGSLVIASVLAIMYQFFGITTTNSNYLAAFRQVQTGGNWITEDTLMARKVMIDDPDTPGVTEFVTLEWTEWAGDQHRVAYILEDMPGGLKQLKRTHSVNNNPGDTDVIAEYIKQDGTTSEWAVDEKELTVVITAQVSDCVLWKHGTWANSATRTYRIIPRPLF
jgi:prepilin-type N-terminal cleavage/methylation domain-containing protein